MSSSRLFTIGMVATKVNASEVQRHLMLQDIQTVLNFLPSYICADQQSQLKCNKRPRIWRSSESV